MSIGRLRPADSRWEIVFSPWLTHPPEKVWQALSDPVSLRAWFPNELHGDRSEGAPLRFTFPGKGDQGAFEGQMRTWDPPRALAFRWGEDELRFELNPEADGTRLTLVDTIDDVSRAARDAAGWHECLDRLQAHLDGQTPDFAAAERREQLHPVYIQEFESHGAASGLPASPPLAGPQADSGSREPLSTGALDTDSGAVTPWDEARSRLVAARTYWLATTRPDGPPRLGPVSGLWVDEVLYLLLSPSSLEADNLTRDPRCAVAVSTLSPPSLQLVVEGEAGMVSHHDHLQRVAEAYAPKYGSRLTVRDGALHRDTAPTADSATHAVFAVTPATVSGFPGDGDVGAAGEDLPDSFGPTQWRFAP